MTKQELIEMLGSNKNESKLIQKNVIRNLSDNDFALFTSMSNKEITVFMTKEAKQYLELRKANKHNKKTVTEDGPKEVNFNNVGDVLDAGIYNPGR